jgi:flap endonuclease-1
MGIKNLNRFLRTNCPKNIKQISLWDLKGKTIAIDASIYMYRFQTDGGLIEGMYQMIGLMKYHKINMIFVFDGKPPPEKAEILKQRREEKAAAEIKYREAKNKLMNCGENEDISDLEAEIDELRKKIVKITSTDIANVKKLLEYMGISYYEAESESDYVCAKLVQKKIAFACLSEDMDMFVYGCPRVLRYLSLLKSTVVIYDVQNILKTLRLSLEDFKKICILAGTDYNIHDTKYDLNKTLRVYAKYTKNKLQCNDFYIWLKENYDESIDIEQLQYILDMFDLTTKTIHKQLMVINRYDNDGLKSYLFEYGFIFV